MDDQIYSKIPLIDIQNHGHLATAPDPSSDIPAPRRSNIFNGEDPTSLKCVLGPCDFLRKAEEYYCQDKTYFEMDERTLHKKIGTTGSPITVSESRLRYKLWSEFDMALEEGRKLDLKNICSGVMSIDRFTRLYTEERQKVAWLLCPPASYETAMREGLGFGIDNMREILDLDPFKDMGKPNVKLAELQFKITTWLDMRVHGNFTQRTEQKNLNIHATMSDGKAREMVKTFSETGSIEALESKLSELEEQEAKILNVPKKNKKNNLVIDLSVQPEKPPRKDF